MVYGRNKMKPKMKMKTKLRYKIMMPSELKMKLRKSGIREQSRGDKV